jgi:solute carrier family 25 (adenine nucleotide translocator) protein 4/5/6/31
MQTSSDNTSLSQLALKVLSASCSVAISHTLHAPLKRIGIILITQHANHQINKQNMYKSALDVLIRIPKEQGWLSFWRGNLPAILRAIPTLGLNFTLRDYYRQLLIRTLM